MSEPPAPRSSLSAELFHDFLLRAAVLVEGTEAIAFAVEQNLRVIAHVRPDGATEEVLARAVNAFEQVVKKALDQGRDLAVEVRVRQPEEKRTQYCLVTLFPEPASTVGVVAVTAVVCWCDDRHDAEQKLSVLREELRKAGR